MSVIATLIQTETIRPAADGWSLPIAFQQFDPSSGTLGDVGLTLVGTVTGVAAIENLGATPATVDLGVNGSLGLYDASGTPYSGGQTIIHANESLTLGAYDGSVDFAGLSGTLVSFSNTGTAVTTTTAGSAVGNEGTGTIGVTVTSSAQTLTEYSTGNILSVTQGEAGATVNLRYDYRTNGTGSYGNGDYSGSGSTFTWTGAQTVNIAAIGTVTPQTTDVQVLRLADAETGWNDILDATQFNPALGTLAAIDITVIGDINGALALENLGTVGTDISLYDTAYVTATLPGGLGSIVVNPSIVTWGSLSGFDGTTDFQGTSGSNQNGLTGTGSSSTSIGANDAFVGTGTVAIGVSALSGATLTAGADLATELLTNAGAIVEISYVYYPTGTGPNQFQTLTGTVTPVTPIITGTAAGVTFVEQSGVAPFAGIAIHNDADIGQTDTVTITQSNPGNGTFGGIPANFGLSGTYAAGVWTATGSAASLTAALQQLVFFASGQVTAGQTIATGFTVAVTDSAGLNAIDTTTSVIETSGVSVDPVVTAQQVSAALLASGVSAKPVSSGTSTGPVLTFQGAPVTASTFPGWTPIAAIQTASGFDIAWKYAPTGQFTVWTTDASGNFTGDPNGLVAADDPSFESIETVFGSDLNGDGSIGLVGAAVGTATASASLAEAGSIYMVQANGGLGFDLQFNGVAVTTSRFPGWTPLAAVRTVSGFDVALKDAATGQYTVWTTDASGNFTGNLTSAVSATDASLETIEATFGVDLNGDGTIGLAGTILATSANTSLMGVGDEYVLKPTSGTAVVLTYGGSGVTPSVVVGWTPIAAVQTASGFDIAWKFASTHQYTVWTTDASGNFTGDPNGAVSATDPSLETIETTFGVDLNGDGTIGVVPITIATSANTSLMSVGGTYALRPTNGTAVDLTYEGSSVTPSTVAGWTPLAAVQTASGFDVAWKFEATGQYTVWTTDASGNFTGDPNGAVSAIDPSLEALETTFGVDLNGDGTIGVVGTTIATSANTSLMSFGGTYVLKPTNGTAVVLTYDGSGVTPSTVAGWTPLAAVQTASGFDVAWKFDATGQYTVWTTDASGNFRGDPNGAVTATDPSLETIETTFGVDLNGDGTIGVVPITIATSANTSLMSVGGTYALKPTNGTAVVLTYQGSGVTPSTVAGWTPLAAVQTASGFDVAWKFNATGQYTVWTTDASGNFAGDPNGAVSAIDPSLEVLEPTFGVDLNGDGTIGVVGTMYSIFNNTTLLVADNTFVVDPATGDDVVLKFQGEPVTTSTFSDFQPIAAVQTGSGYEVAWGQKDTGQYIVWNTDADGNYLSDPGGLVNTLTLFSGGDLTLRADYFDSRSLSLYVGSGNLISLTNLTIATGGDITIGSNPPIAPSGTITADSVLSTGFVSSAVITGAGLYAPTPTLLTDSDLVLLPPSLAIGTITTVPNIDLVSAAAGAMQAYDTSVGVATASSVASTDSMNQGTILPSAGTAPTLTDLPANKFNLFDTTH